MKMALFATIASVDEGNQCVCQQNEGAIGTLFLATLGDNSEKLNAYKKLLENDSHAMDGAMAQIPSALPKPWTLKSTMSFVDASRATSSKSLAARPG